MTWYRRRGKRLLDVAGSAAGLVLLSPVLALVALAIKLLDPGPVFFAQQRAGRDFKPFRMYKFRSMKVGGKGPQITSDGDARITPLGRLLRKTKLDELPQLFNVLRGDMSLVGPRPTVPKYAEMYRSEYEVILSVQPGITDWASIRFRDEEGVLRSYEEPEAGYMDDVLPEKLALYRRYIAEVSLWTDLRILAATAFKLLDKGVAPSPLRFGDPLVMIRRMTASDRRFVVLGLDLVAVLAAYAGAFALRGDALLIETAPWAVLAYLPASYWFGVNRGLRYYASFGDVFDCFKAVACAALAHAALFGREVPAPVLVLWPMLALFAVTGLHAGLHAASHFLRVRLGGGRRRCAVIVGIGDLAELAYQNMRAHESIDYRVAAFFDPGRARVAARLHGVPVLYGAARLAELARRKRVDEVVVAVSRERRGRALDVVAQALQGLDPRPEVLVLPALHEASRAPRKPEPRRVEAGDLLDRRVIPLDRLRIGRMLEGKVVLVTGAGGVIGGELARQALSYQPRKLILLDNHATALFYRETELRQHADGAELLAALGDVRDLSLLDRIFQDERPQVVFHAAAHKHVYQLETNVQEGVSNNLLATYHLAGLADRKGAETFILVSTDKAQSPTTVMSATKRAAELVLCSLARTSKTTFASVRFGSVLGSAASVLKLFQDQLEKGRPLTLTQPDAARYFMTTEEAAGLILQAAAQARGGDIYALKLGEQIRVMDIARSLVRLAGLDPDVDVDIRFMGPKLGEDDPAVEAGHEPTDHPAIAVLRSDAGQLDALSERILSLELLSYTAGKDAMVRALSELVPAFKAPRLPQDFRIHPAPDTLGPSTN